MRLAFLPGELVLEKIGRDYVVTIQGEEVFKSAIEKKALTEYNRLRKEMEIRFPATEMTPEQKRKALENLIGEIKFTQVRNSMKKPIEKKIAKTRTFG